MYGGTISIVAMVADIFDLTIHKYTSAGLTYISSSSSSGIVCHLIRLLAGSGAKHGVVVGGTNVSSISEIMNRSKAHGACLEADQSISNNVSTHVVSCQQLPYVTSTSTTQWELVDFRFIQGENPDFLIYRRNRISHRSTHPHPPLPQR